MLRRITVLILIAGLTTAYLSPLAMGAAPAQKQNSQRHNAKLAPEFDSATGSNDQVRVIIQTKGHPTAAHEDAVRAKGGAKGRTFESFDVMTATVPQGAIADLASRDDVAYISPDRKVAGELAVTRETTGAALELAHRFHVDLPITSEMGTVLNGDRSPAEAIGRLMSRALTREIRNN